MGDRRLRGAEARADHALGQGRNRDRQLGARAALVDERARPRDIGVDLRRRAAQRQRRAGAGGQGAQTVGRRQRTIGLPGQRRPGTADADRGLEHLRRIGGSPGSGVGRAHQVGRQQQLAAGGQGVARRQRQPRTEAHRFGQAQLGVDLADRRPALPHGLHRDDGAGIGHTTRIAQQAAGRRQVGVELAGGAVQRERGRALRRRGRQQGPARRAAQGRRRRPVQAAGRGRDGHREGLVRHRVATLQPEADQRVGREGQGRERARGHHHRRRQRQPHRVAQGGVRRRRAERDGHGRATRTVVQRERQLGCDGGIGPQRRAGVLDTAGRTGQQGLQRVGPALQHPGARVLALHRDGRGGTLGQRHRQTLARAEREHSRIGQAERQAQQRRTGGRAVVQLDTGEAQGRTLARGDRQRPLRQHHGGRHRLARRLEGDARGGRAQRHARALAEGQLQPAGRAAGLGRDAAIGECAGERQQGPQRRGSALQRQRFAVGGGVDGARAQAHAGRIAQRVVGKGAEPPAGRRGQRQREDLIGRSRGDHGLGQHQWGAAGTRQSHALRQVQTGGDQPARGRAHRDRDLAPRLQRRGVHGLHGDLQGVGQQGRDRQPAGGDPSIDLVGRARDGDGRHAACRRRDRGRQARRHARHQARHRCVDRQRQHGTAGKAQAVQPGQQRGHRAGQHLDCGRQHQTGRRAQGGGHERDVRRGARGAGFGPDLERAGGNGRAFSRPVKQLARAAQPGVDIGRRARQRHGGAATGGIGAGGHAQAGPGCRREDAAHGRDQGHEHLPAAAADRQQVLGEDQGAAARGHEGQRLRHRGAQCRGLRGDLDRGQRSLRPGAHHRAQGRVRGHRHPQVGGRPAVVQPARRREVGIERRGRPGEAAHPTAAAQGDTVGIGRLPGLDRVVVVDRQRALADRDRDGQGARAGERRRRQPQLAAGGGQRKGLRQRQLRTHHRCLRRRRRGDGDGAGAAHRRDHAQPEAGTEVAVIPGRAGLAEEVVQRGDAARQPGGDVARPPVDEREGLPLAHLDAVDFGQDEPLGRRQEVEHHGVVGLGRLQQRAQQQRHARPGGGHQTGRQRQPRAGQRAGRLGRRSQRHHLLRFAHRAAQRHLQADGRAAVHGARAGVDDAPALGTGQPVLQLLGCAGEQKFACTAGGRCRLACGVDEGPGSVHQRQPLTRAERECVASGQAQAQSQRRLGSDRTGFEPRAVEGQRGRAASSDPDLRRQRRDARRCRLLWRLQQHGGRGRARRCRSTGVEFDTQRAVGPVQGQPARRGEPCSERVDRALQEQRTRGAHPLDRDADAADGGEFGPDGAGASRRIDRLPIDEPPRIRRRGQAQHGRGAAGQARAGPQRTRGQDDRQRPRQREGQALGQCQGGAVLGALGWCDRHGGPARGAQRRVGHADQLHVQRHGRISTQRQTALAEVDVQRGGRATQHHRALVHRWRLGRGEHLHLRIGRRDGHQLRPGTDADGQVEQRRAAEVEARGRAQPQRGQGPLDHLELGWQQQPRARDGGRQIDRHGHRDLGRTLGQCHDQRTFASSGLQHAVVDRAEAREMSVQGLELARQRGHLAIHAVDGLDRAADGQPVGLLHLELGPRGRHQRDRPGPAAARTAKDRLLEHDRRQALCVHTQGRGRGDGRSRQGLRGLQRLHQGLGAYPGRPAADPHVQGGSGVDLRTQRAGGRQPGVQVGGQAAHDQPRARAGGQRGALRVDEAGAAGLPAQRATVQRQLDLQHAGARDRGGRQPDGSRAGAHGVALRQRECRAGLAALRAEVRQRDRCPRRDARRGRLAGHPFGAWRAQQHLQHAIGAARHPQGRHGRRQPGAERLRGAGNGQGGLALRRRSLQGLAGSPLEPAGSGPVQAAAALGHELQRQPARAGHGVGGKGHRYLCAGRQGQAGGHTDRGAVLLGRRLRRRQQFGPERRDAGRRRQTQRQRQRGARAVDRRRTGVDDTARRHESLQRRGLALEHQAVRRGRADDDAHAVIGLRLRRQPLTTHQRVRGGQAQRQAQQALTLEIGPLEAQRRGRAVADPQPGRRLCDHRHGRDGTARAIQTDRGARLQGQPGLRIGAQHADGQRLRRLSGVAHEALRVGQEGAEVSGPAGKRQQAGAGTRHRDSRAARRREHARDLGHRQRERQAIGAVAQGAPAVGTAGEDQRTRRIGDHDDRARQCTHRRAHDGRCGHLGRGDVGDERADPISVLLQRRRIGDQPAFGRDLGASGQIDPLRHQQHPVGGDGQRLRGHRVGQLTSNGHVTRARQEQARRRRRRGAEQHRAGEVVAGQEGHPRHRRRGGHGARGGRRLALQRLGLEQHDDARLGRLPVGTKVFISRAQAQALAGAVIGAVGAREQARARDDTGGGDGEIADQAVEGGERASQQGDVGTGIDRHRDLVVRRCSHPQTLHRQCAAAAQADVTRQHHQVLHSQARDVARAVEIDQRQAAFVDLSGHGIDGHREFGHAANAQGQQIRRHHGRRQVVGRAPDGVGFEHHVTALRALWQTLSQPRGEGRRHHARQHHLPAGTQGDIAAATADERAGRLTQVAGGDEHDVAAADAGGHVARPEVRPQQQIAPVGHRAVVGRHHPGHERDAARTGLDAHAGVDRRVGQDGDGALGLDRHATAVAGSQPRELEVMQGRRQPGGDHTGEAHVVQRTDLQCARHRQADVAGRGVGRDTLDVGQQRLRRAAHPGAGLDAQALARHRGDAAVGAQRARHRAAGLQRQVLSGHHLGQAQTPTRGQADVAAAAVHARPGRRAGSGIDLHRQAGQACLQVDAAALGHDGGARAQRQRATGLQGHRPRRRIHAGLVGRRGHHAPQGDLDVRADLQVARRAQQQVGTAEHLDRPVDDDVADGGEHADRAAAGHTGRHVRGAAAQALPFEHRQDLEALRPDPGGAHNFSVDRAERQGAVVDQRHARLRMHRQAVHRRGQRRVAAAHAAHAVGRIDQQARAPDMDALVAGLDHRVVDGDGCGAPHPALGADQGHGPRRRRGDRGVAGIEVGHDDVAMRADHDVAGTRAAGDDAGRSLLLETAAGLDVHRATSTGDAVGIAERRAARLPHVAAGQQGQCPTAHQDVVGDRQVAPGGLEADGARRVEAHLDQTAHRLSTVADGTRLPDGQRAGGTHQDATLVGQAQTARHGLRPGAGARPALPGDRQVVDVVDRDDRGCAGAGARLQPVGVDAQGLSGRADGHRVEVAARGVQRLQRHRPAAEREYPGVPAPGRGQQAAVQRRQRQIATGVHAGQPDVTRRLGKHHVSGGLHRQGGAFGRLEAHLQGRLVQAARDEDAAAEDRGRAGCVVTALGFQEQVATGAQQRHGQQRVVHREDRALGLEVHQAARLQTHRRQARQRPVVDLQVAVGAQHDLAVADGAQHAADADVQVVAHLHRHRAQLAPVLHPLATAHVGQAVAGGEHPLGRDLAGAHHAPQPGVDVQALGGEVQRGVVAQVLVTLVADLDDVLGVDPVQQLPRRLGQRAEVAARGGDRDAVGRAAEAGLAEDHRGVFGIAQQAQATRALKRAGGQVLTVTEGLALGPRGLRRHAPGVKPELGLLGDLKPVQIEDPDVLGGRGVELELDQAVETVQAGGQRRARGPPLGGVVERGHLERGQPQHAVAAGRGLRRHAEARVARAVD